MKHMYGKFKVNTRDNHRYKHDLDVVNCVLRADTYRARKLTKYLPAPKTIIDIGGHVGAFGLLAKELWPDVRIVAFEPNLKNVELYRANMADNGLTNVKVRDEAVSYEPDKNILTDHQRATGGGFMCNQVRAKEFELNPPKRDDGLKPFVVRREIKLLTLEEVMEQENISRIDLLKTDCEGSEREIFKQMKDETLEKIGSIIGEYHIDGGYPNFEKLFYSRFKHLKLIRLNPKNTTNIGEFIAVPEAVFNARPDMAAWLNSR